MDIRVNSNSLPRSSDPVASEDDATTSSNLLHGLNDKPALHTCFLLGIQHCMLSVGGLIGVPLILANEICMPYSEVGYTGRALILNSLFFVFGLMTFLQTTFGTRLPILQGASFTFLPPALALLSLPQNQCPNGPVNDTGHGGSLLYNDTDGALVDGSELWMRRMRQIQGALAVASIVEVILGACGAIGYIMKFIGPLTITTAITLVGISLFNSASGTASTHWGIAFLTIAILAILSQYLRNFEMPCPLYTREKGCHVSGTQFLKLFSVFITVIVAWMVCWALTISGSLPNDPLEYGYAARTDIRISVLNNSPWFRIPYPGQWGVPVVTAAGVVGMLTAVLSGIVGSVGDYYACSQLCSAPPLPKHALNRGITVEGIGCVLAGLIGTGCGTTSYAENIAAIGITRVASRRVLQAAGITFFIFGMLGKVGAVFVLIPDPILGGLFFVTFGMIVSIGLANLKHVDLTSTRNLFVFGFSIFSGMSIPLWLARNRDAINTGSEEADQILNVLIGTPNILGGVIAAFLDNTLPGSREERGINSWNSDISSRRDVKGCDKSCYDLPFSTNWRYSHHIPILPEYDQKQRNKRSEIHRF